MLLAIEDQLGTGAIPTGDLVTSIAALGYEWGSSDGS